jgi:hypothetical protein
VEMVALGDYEGASVRGLSSGYISATILIRTAENTENGHELAFCKMAHGAHRQAGLTPEGNRPQNRNSGISPNMMSCFTQDSDRRLGGRSNSAAVYQSVRLVPDLMVTDVDAMFCRWHIAPFDGTAAIRQQLGVKQTNSKRRSMNARNICDASTGPLE